MTNICDCLTSFLISKTTWISYVFFIALLIGGGCHKQQYAVCSVDEHKHYNFGQPGHIIHRPPPSHQRIRYEIFNIADKAPYFDIDLRQNVNYQIELRRCFRAFFDIKDIFLLIEQNGKVLKKIDMDGYKYPFINFMPTEFGKYRIHVQRKVNKQGCITVEIYQPTE